MDRGPQGDQDKDNRPPFFKSGYQSDISWYIAQDIGLEDRFAMMYTELCDSSSEHTFGHKENLYEGRAEGLSEVVLAWKQVVKN